MYWPGAMLFGQSGHGVEEANYVSVRDRQGWSMGAESKGETNRQGNVNGLAFLEANAHLLRSSSSIY